MNKHDREMLAQIDLELQQGHNSVEHIEILLKRKDKITNFYERNKNIPKRGGKTVKYLDRRNEY